MADQAIGCVGRCLNGLTRDDVHLISLNVHNCLTYPKGNELFGRYLEERALSDSFSNSFSDSFKCWNVYNRCSECAEEQKIQGNSLESLISKVERIKETVEDLDVPELDFDLMTKFNEALKEITTEKALLAVLKLTEERCQDHLRSKHESFTNIL